MASQSAVTLLTGCVDVVSFSIMSRLLSQSDFGYYAAITAITSIFACFADAGIGSAIIQQKEISEKFLNVAYTVSFFCGLIATTTLFVLSYPLAKFVVDKSMTLPLMLISITLLTNCIASVNISLLHRNLNFMKVGLINLFALVVTTIVAVALAYLGYGYYAILVKSIMASLITLVLSKIYSHSKFKFEWDSQVFKKIIGFSGWLTASGFFRDLALQLDRLMMSNLLSVSALGAYNRPKEFISQISNKIAGIFDTALFPVLAQLQDNKESMKNSYNKSLYLLNLASVIFALIFVFNADLVIRIFFGEEWLSITPVFQLLSLTVIFTFDARLSDCYFRSLGWTKQQFYFRIFEVAIRLVGLLIGFNWSIIGVATSFLVTSIIIVLIKYSYISRKIGVGFYRTCLIILKSWKMCFFAVPLLLIGQIVIPHSFISSILMLFVSIMVVIIPLLFAPKLVGEPYASGEYLMVKKTIIKLKAKVCRSHYYKRGFDQ